MSSKLITLNQGTWTQITTADKDGSIRHHSGNTAVVYLESATAPTGFSTATPTMETTMKGESFTYWGVSLSDFLWAFAISSGASITVTPKGA